MCVVCMAMKKGLEVFRLVPGFGVAFFNLVLGSGIKIKY